MGTEDWFKYVMLAFQNIKLSNNSEIIDALFSVSAYFAIDHSRSSLVAFVPLQ